VVVSFFLTTALWFFIWWILQSQNGLCKGLQR
jgi:hypothetical protein